MDNSRIKFFIEAIDDDLLRRGKTFLHLGYANTLLFEKGLISKLEKRNGYLKGLLENNNIPNAGHTETTPKQWRIYLSPAGRRKKKSSKRIIKPQPVQEMWKPDKAISIKAPNQNNKTITGWIIAVFIAVIILTSLYSGGNNSNSSKYLINTTTYAATSKEFFDEMFMYFRDRDELALNLMILDGEVKILEQGTEVNLIKSQFTYSVVREMGSRQELWIVTDHLDR